MSLPLTIPTGLGALYTDGNNIYRIWFQNATAYAVTLDQTTGYPQFSEVYTYPQAYVEQTFAPYTNDGQAPIFPSAPTSSGSPTSTDSSTPSGSSGDGPVS